MKMQSKMQWMLYQALELIPASEPARVQPQPISVWVRKMWQSLLDMSARQSEPQVWQSVDRSGNTWWNVYHPGTRESVVLESEQEVRIWLEQSFCR